MSEENKKPNLDSAKSKSGNNPIFTTTVKGKKSGSILSFSKVLIVLHTYHRNLGLVDDLYAKLLVSRRFHNTNKNRLDNK